MSDEPSFGDARQAALDALAGGDPRGAFASFRRALWYPARLPPEQLADGLAVLAAIFEGMGHSALGVEAARAASDLQDPEALYDLGFALIEAGLSPIAAVVLTRCLEVVPGSEQVLTELVSALERNLAYREARALLDAHPQLVESSFLCGYLLAYNAAMSGDLATTRSQVTRLCPDDEVQHFMVARLHALLARADRVLATDACAAVARLDDRDLRGWHYVLSGGVLTHLSPYGFDDPMHGRYAWLQDSAPRVRTGIERLVGILRHWQLAPPCVYAPPGRDHEILGHAVAASLGVPLAPWPAVGVPAPGLIAIYDLAAVDGRDIERLIDRRPDQIVYAHASPWTEDRPVAPDVTTLLYQSLVAPWSERLRLDLERRPERDPEDDRAIEVIAAEIAAAPPLPDDDTAVDDLAGLRALVDRVGPLPQERRERLWAGSPVPSSRFD